METPQQQLAGEFFHSNEWKMYTQNNNWKRNEYIWNEWKKKLLYKNDETFIWRMNMIFLYIFTLMWMEYQLDTFFFILCMKYEILLAKCVWLHWKSKKALFSIHSNFLSFAHTLSVTTTSFCLLHFHVYDMKHKWWLRIWCYWYLLQNNGKFFSESELFGMFFIFVSKYKTRIFEV